MGSDSACPEYRGRSPEEYFWTYHSNHGQAHAFTSVDTLILSGESLRRTESGSGAMELPPTGRGRGSPKGNSVFVEAWNQQTGGTHQLDMDQGLFEVKESIYRIQGENWSGNRGTPEYPDPFAAGFAAECFPSRTLNEANSRCGSTDSLPRKKRFSGRTRQGNLSPWPVLFGIPQYQQHLLGLHPTQKTGLGLRRLCGGSLSQEQLRRGKRACNLHTDLENATSNALYLRLGYQPIERQTRLS